MRIITGIAKGKKLKAPAGADTRPTADAVKEAMFSAVQFDVEGAVVLDLFAGSGQLGIEALSRGAEKACFVDNSAEAVAVIKENLENSGLLERARVDRLPFSAFLRGERLLQFAEERFDIVFIDPPYNKGLVLKALNKLVEKMNPDGIIICEHEKELSLPENVGGFKTDKVYRHGSASVTIYRK